MEFGGLCQQDASRPCRRLAGPATRLGSGRACRFLIACFIDARELNGAKVHQCHKHPHNEPPPSIAEGPQDRYCLLSPCKLHMKVN